MDADEASNGAGTSRARASVDVLLGGAFLAAVTEARVGAGVEGRSATLVVISAAGWAGDAGGVGIDGILESAEPEAISVDRSASSARTPTGPAACPGSLVAPRKNDPSPTSRMPIVSILPDREILG